MDKMATERTKTELRAEVVYWKKEMQRFRAGHFSFKSFDYEDYSTFIAIRDKAYTSIDEMRARGLSKRCDSRILAFLDEAFKAEKMLDKLLNWW